MPNTNFVNKKVVPLGYKKRAKCPFQRISADIGYVKMICPRFV